MNMDDSIKINSMTSLEETFLKSGLADLTDKQAIELILAASLQGRGYKQLARRCHGHFRGLSEFLSASPRQLEQLGVPARCYFCIKLIREMPSKVLRQKIIDKPISKNSEDVFNYLYYSMRDLKKEVFKVLYLDNRDRILDVIDLFEGSANAIYIRPREIVESLINNRSTAMIFVHNHPSGDPTPSRTDKALTRDLVFIGFILQIKILDHIIIGQDTYFSFADEGLIKKYQDSFLTLQIKGVFSSEPIQRHYCPIRKEILGAAKKHSLMS